MLHILSLCLHCKLRILYHKNLTISSYKKEIMGCETTIPKAEQRFIFPRNTRSDSPRFPTTRRLRLGTLKDVLPTLSSRAARAFPRRHSIRWSSSALTAISRASTTRRRRKKTLIGSRRSARKWWSSATPRPLL